MSVDANATIYLQTPHKSAVSRGLPAFRGPLGVGRHPLKGSWPHRAEHARVSVEGGKCGGSCYIRWEQYVVAADPADFV